MEGKCKQAVLSLPAQTMTERNLKSDQECETLMTVEKESTMAILAMEVRKRKVAERRQIWKKGMESWLVLKTRMDSLEIQELKKAFRCY